jgi:hypothetical protein
MHFSSLHVCYMTCQSRSPWFGHPNNVWWRVQIMYCTLIKFQSMSRVDKLEI